MNLLEQLNKEEKARLEQLKKQVEQEFKPMREKVELIEKLKKAKKSPERFKESLKLLCWGSPAYCCRSGEGGKPCLWRDTFLEINNITLKEFEEMKEKFTKEFMKKLA